MLAHIKAGNDLYSEKAYCYIFCYNEAGSVCTYNLDMYEAKKLAQEASQADEYWGALLGIGGSIYDDPSHECYTEDKVSNLEICEQLAEYDDWEDCNVYGKVSYWKVVSRFYDNGKTGAEFSKITAYSKPTSTVISKDEYDEYTDYYETAEEGLQAYYQALKA